ncbi:hypothetical protein [Mucilaginibacter glaciei]|uniref:Uncharacterized protein n=1 Tax=Mucilaginibacter glaciei TaxID=2772109 RepID=A0A926NHR8_9SPHI|nr:hypothetical protein [Mucilaginibacter glaciei]MBD1392294.1 hypothetical protein [Mucilaginibacter glaciei]
MKRLFAMVLLCVHLFNTGGYNLIFQYFIHQSEVQMVKNIYENKVDATQLVQIKIPMRSPGLKDWTDYEHIQGQVQLKDAFYNYVGMKMTHDTMYLVCVANDAKTKLVNANIIVAKNVSDVPVSKKGQEQTVKKSATGFECSIPAAHYKFVAFANVIEPKESPISIALTDPYIESPGKPPTFSA